MLNSKQVITGAPMKKKIAASSFLAIIALLSIALFCGACRDRSSSSTNSKPVLPNPPARSIQVQSFADIVQKVAPAVVTVRSARWVRPARPFPFFNDPLFRNFFGYGDRPSRPQLEQGLGSGVIVTEDGYIVTNHHVIDGATDIKIEMGEGRTVDAKIIGSDAPSDLAVLKISAGKLTALPLGNSDQVRVGDMALAIGNPLGIGQTVTAGIISAKERATG
jgi:S1-C subfamily serine protease